MSKMIQGTACAIAALSLAGCGGGNSTVGNPGLISASEQLLRVFADTDGDGIGDQDVADVLDADQSLVARQVSDSTWREDYASGGSYTNIDGEVRLQGDGDDLLVTFNVVGDPSPTTVRIVNARAIATNSVRIDNANIFFDIFVGRGLTIGDLLDSTVGNGYAIELGIYFQDKTDNFGIQNRFIIGTETQDAMIDQLAASNTIATYSGFANIDIRRDNAGWNTYNGRVDGNLDMTANFGTATVSGTISNLNYTEAAGTTVDPMASGPISGNISMNPTSIQANAFQGSMSGDATMASSNPDAATFVSGLTYSGAFYGPQAEEIGGSISGSATISGGQGLLGSGFFRGN